MMAGEEEKAPDTAGLVSGVEAEAAEPPETPATFLADLSTTLKSTDGIDAGLANVIADHLLIVSPNANAVLNAKAAIVAIASQRAAADAAEEEDTSNG